MLKKHYIVAGDYKPSAFHAYHERYQSDPDWQAHSLPCGHDVMAVLPDELAELLAGVV